MVSGDRAGLYADAARQGAPQARQVADRFHLLQNFRETVERQLGRFEAPISDSQVNASDNQATPPLPARSDCASDAVIPKAPQLTHIVDSQRARFLTPLAWGDLRHAISGQIARGLFG